MGTRINIGRAARCVMCTSLQETLGWYAHPANYRRCIVTISLKNNKNESINIMKGKYVNYSKLCINKEEICISIKNRYDGEAKH